MSTKALHALVLCLIVLFSLSVQQAWAVNLGQKAVDEVFLEKEIESSLTRDIRAYLGHDRFIVGVDFQLSGSRAPGGEDEVIIREITTPLPGLPKASETFTKELTQDELNNLEESLFLEGQVGTRSSLADSQSANALTGSGTEVYLVLDTTVNSVQETFIRELIARKLSLDVAGGDSVQVVRSTFNGGVSTAPVAEPSPAPQQQQPLQPQFFPGGFPVQQQQAPLVKDTVAEEKEPLVIPTVEEIAAAVAAATSAASEGGDSFWEENFPLIVIVSVLFFLLLMLLMFLLLRRSPAYPATPYYPQAQPAPALATSPETSLSGAKSIQDDDSRVVRNSIGEVRREIASIGLASPETSRTEMEGMWSQSRMDVIAPVYRVLGEDVFESLFGSMSPGQKSEVGDYLSEREISDTQLEAQSKEFYARLVRSASESTQTNRAQAFKFLDKLHLSQILFLIKGEKTRIQALIVSQLPSKTASAVLQSLDAKQRSEVIHELAQFETFPVETFRDVAALLAKKSRKLPAVENVQTDGIGILMNLLDSMNSVEESKVLSDLETKDPELHQKLRTQYFTFTDLARAPQKIMGEALLDIDKGSLAAALTGSGENVIRRVLGSLPKRLADSVKEEMNLLKGKLDEEQIQSSRRVIVGRMRELVRDGKIEMDKI